MGARPWKQAERKDETEHWDAPSEPELVALQEFKVGAEPVLQVLHWHLLPCHWPHRKQHRACPAQVFTTPQSGQFRSVREQQETRQIETQKEEGEKKEDAA